MRFPLLISLLLLLTLGAQADPGYKVPWAQPQSFPEEKVNDEDVPIFERAMREERRRKEAGIKETVTVEDLKTKTQPRPPATPEQTPTATTEPAPFKTLERGAKGPQVETVQKTLLSLGFGLPAGADGDYGGQTVDAVKAFQSSQDLEVTGKLDEEAFELLTAISPAPGKKIWEDPDAVTKSIPQRPSVSGNNARVLVDLSEHRLFVYDSSGTVQRVFPISSGAEDTPTDPGIKVVTEKLADPTKLAEKLWPDSKGKAFGNRLIDLNWYDPDTGAQTISDEELHGTYVLNSIGAYASHGCMRLTNDSIEWLYQNLTVGDIVVIRE